MLGAHAGALLAVGILNCGVQHENDPAYALLHDFVDKQDPVVRIGAIMGLGLAYAGTQKEEVGRLSVWENVHVSASCLSRCCNSTGLLFLRPGRRLFKGQRQYCIPARLFTGYLAGRLWKVLPLTASWF